MATNGGGGVNWKGSPTGLVVATALLCWASGAQLSLPHVALWIRIATSGAALVIAIYTIWLVHNRTD